VQVGDPTVERRVSAVPEARLRDLALELGRPGPRGDAFRQIAVRLAVAPDQLADPRDHVMEVEAEERGEAGRAHLGDLERDHAPARPGHPPHLAQALLEVGQVAEQERARHAGERARVEGQGQRVGGQQAHAAPLVEALQLVARHLQHAEREVGRDHRAMRVHLGQIDGEIAGAGGQVERGAVGRCDCLARGHPAPVVVHAERHEAVHQVVAARDAREHRAHEAGLLDALERVGHASRPPRTERKRITAM